MSSKSGSLAGAGTTRRAADRAQPAPPAAAVPTLDGRLEAAEREERAAALEEQDALLDRLSSTVGVIHEMSGRISGELDAQAAIIDDASLAAELARGDVDAVTRRVNKLVERAGGRGWCGVLTTLTVVLIILTWIAFT